LVLCESDKGLTVVNSVLDVHRKVGHGILELLVKNEESNEKGSEKKQLLIRNT
jgi:hypothetical protein